MAQAKMDPNSRALMKINGLTPFPVQTVKHYLHHLEQAYVCILGFETLIDSALERLRYIPGAVAALPREKRDAKLEQARHEAVSSGIWQQISSRSVDPTFDPHLLMDVNWELTLSAVELHSPGFWEFLIKFSPAEVIRQYLNDRHERKKDTKYRNTAEEARLQLQVEILKNQVITERIQIARSLGGTDADFRPLLNALVTTPLRDLDAIQDMGVISTAEIHILPSESETKTSSVAAA